MFPLPCHQIASPDDVGAVFYRHLFARHPELRPLFSSVDMGTLHAKLLQSITLCVAGLRDPGALRPAINELGRRHIAYGALEKHLMHVGEALLLALEELSGPKQWTPAIATAWTRAFMAVAGMMTEGMR